MRKWRSIRKAVRAPLRATRHHTHTLIHSLPRAKLPITHNKAPATTLHAFTAFKCKCIRILSLFCFGLKKKKRKVEAHKSASHNKGVKKIVNKTSIQWPVKPLTTEQSEVNDPVPIQVWSPVLVCGTGDILSPLVWFFYTTPPYITITSIISKGRDGETRKKHQPMETTAGAASGPE